MNICFFMREDTFTEKTAYEDLPSLYSSPNIITVTNQILKKESSGICIMWWT